MAGLGIVAAAAVLAALGLPNDFFGGCREREADAEDPDCVYVLREWLKSETYRRFAHMTLGNFSYRSGDYYNTVLKITRAANQEIPVGIGMAVEFTTVPSSCKVTDTPVYSKELCRPTSNKVKDFTLVANAQALFKNCSYAAKMTLSDKGDILESHCECPRGSAKYSDMMATALYAALNGLSKTDLRKQWMQRPKSSMPRQVARSGEWSVPSQVQRVSTTKTSGGILSNTCLNLKDGT